MANTLQSTPATGSTTSPGMSTATTEQQGAVAHKADEARHEAAEVARDAKREVQRTMAETRRQLEHRADDQARQMAVSLRDVGEQLHSMAAGTSSGTGMVNDVVRQLADGVSGAARRIDEGGLQATMTDLRRFARNRPGMFLAGALGAGVLVGRMLRASDLHSIADAAKGDGDDDHPEGIGQWSYGESTEEPLYPGSTGATTPMFESPAGGGYETPVATEAPLYPPSTEVRP